jgi:hypothetical protein
MRVGSARGGGGGRGPWGAGGGGAGGSAEPWCTMWMWSTLCSYRVVEKTPIYIMCRK